MRHYGDITKLNGAELPVVDCITGGSPCQDLSVAGKRAGLDGERSGLFMEQIRIVKEMREHDRSTGRADWMVRPRYLVWENVAGAFSSNHGRDFQAVLTEFVKIVCEDAPNVPMPDKWSKSGCLYDELGRWSIAWRVHDAQFWGVPQRRKRISVIADFGGMSAPEILFERNGMRWDSPQSRNEGQEVARDTGKGTFDAIGVDVYNQSITGVVAAAVTTAVGSGTYSSGPRVLTTYPIENHPNDSRVRLKEDGVVQTLSGRMGTGGGNTPMVLNQHSATQTAIRRLTPLECERLQGFPDGWTDIGEWVDTNGKMHKESTDSARYKALGNSIAIPFWFWLLRRISAQYERPATLGSLFDGIGGFPLCWERCNGKGTALWASEIEEFPIAVTKRRFPDAKDAETHT